jgi:hypothetical protein
MNLKLRHTRACFHSILSIGNMARLQQLVAPKKVKKKLTISKKE